MNLRAVSSGAVERFARYEALQQSSAASKLPDVAWKVLRPEDGIRAPASLRTPPSEACLSEQEVFRNFDLNGDGLISKEEMSYALRSIGRRGSARTVNRLIKSVDADGNGQLDEKEFNRLMHERHEMTVRPLEEMSLSGSSDSDDALRRKIIDLDPQTTRRVPSGVKVAGTEKVKSKTNLLQEKKRRPTENLSVQMVRAR